MKKSKWLQHLFPYSPHWRIQDHHLISYLLTATLAKYFVKLSKAFITFYGSLREFAVRFRAQAVITAAVQEVLLLSNCRCDYRTFNLDSKKSFFCRTFFLIYKAIKFLWKYRHQIIFIKAKHTYSLTLRSFLSQ